MRYRYRPIPNATAETYQAQMSEDMRAISAHLEGLSRGSIDGSDGLAAAPTARTWKQGDFVRNSAPVEAGTTPNKYVILGWVCVASGTPGTWLACRCLTGN